MGGDLEDIMPLEERKVRLTKLARRESFDRQFHATNVIEAIEALNKIDGIYKQPAIESPLEVHHTFIFVLPDGTRFTPGLTPLPITKLLTTPEAKGDVT